MTSAARWLKRRANDVAVGLMGLMFISFLLQIAFRYVLNQPLGWTERLINTCRDIATQHAIAVSVDVRGERVAGRQRDEADGYVGRAQDCLHAGALEPGRDVARGAGRPIVVERSENRRRGHAADRHEHADRKQQLDRREAGVMTTDGRQASVRQE